MRGAAECVANVATTFWRFFVIFLLRKTTATLNLIVLICNYKSIFVNGNVIYVFVLQ